MQYQWKDGDFRETILMDAVKPSRFYRIGFTDKRETVFMAITSPRHYRGGMIVKIRVLYSTYEGFAYWVGQDRDFFFRHDNMFALREEETNYNCRQ
jgi:hypothetical protein